MTKVLILSLLALCTSAHAERPIKNITIMTPDSHAQPLPPMTAKSSEPTTWEKPASHHAVTNVHRGRWITAANFEMYQTWIRNTDYFVLNLGASLEYFFTDRWSLGGSLTVNHVSSFTDVYLGPSSSYYFYLEDRLGAYATTALSYRFVDRTDDVIRWKNGIGVRYFITPAVALGPEVFFSHTFGMGNATSYNQLGVQASFSLHL